MRLKSGVREGRVKSVRNCVRETVRPVRSSLVHTVRNKVRRNIWVGFQNTVWKGKEWFSIIKWLDYFNILVTSFHTPSLTPPSPFSYVALVVHSVSIPYFYLFTPGPLLSASNIKPFVVAHKVTFKTFLLRCYILPHWAWNSLNIHFVASYLGSWSRLLKCHFQISTISTKPSISSL